MLLIILMSVTYRFPPFTVGFFLEGSDTYLNHDFINDDELLVSDSSPMDLSTFVFINM